MGQLIAGVMLGVLVVMGAAGSAWSAEPKVIQTHKTKDVVITLKGESGQWSKGKNAFVIEFTSAKNTQPIDVRTLSLDTNITMPGMSPMVAGAPLLPGKAPGRDLGPAGV